MKMEVEKSAETKKDVEAAAESVPSNQPAEWETLLPEPPLPKTDFDASIGASTGVVTSDNVVDSDASIVSLINEEDKPKAISKTQQAHDDWLESILSTIVPVADNHPFAPAAKLADTKQAPPTRRVEDWRFTDLRPVFAARYVKPTRVDSVNVDAQRHMDDGASAALVFINGQYSADKSLFDDASVSALKAAGGTIGCLDDLNLSEMFSREEFTGAMKRKGYTGMFPAINTAMARDAAVIDVPENYLLDKPIIVLCVTTGGTTAESTHASAPRVAIRAAAGSSVHVVEVHKTESGETHSLALASTAVSVGDDAHVRHAFAGELSDYAQVISQIVATVGKKGRYVCTHLLVGGRVARLEPTIELLGEEAHGECIGAAVATDRRVTDLHSRIVHGTTNTTSKQLQKNIAGERGRAVFSGRIIVPEGSDFTDAEQLCRSLLLSDKAQVDAMPVLEISTDEVKATHGATVSDLQPDEVFYCQSRGLSVEQARTLLIGGFVREVLSDCPMKYLDEICQPVVDRTAEKYQESKERLLELSSI